jgi:hypothetical protein
MHTRIHIEWNDATAGERRIMEQKTTHTAYAQVIANQKRVNDFNIYDNKYTYNDCLDKRGRSE